MLRTMNSAAVAAATLLLSASVAFGASHSAHVAKKSKTGKFAPVTYVCQHGCKQKITVKSEGDWKKTCAVCGCKKTNKECKMAHPNADHH